MLRATAHNCRRLAVHYRSHDRGRDSGRSFRPPTTTAGLPDAMMELESLFKACRSETQQPRQARRICWPTNRRLKFRAWCKIPARIESALCQPSLPAGSLAWLTSSQTRRSPVLSEENHPVAVTDISLVQRFIRGATLSAWLRITLPYMSTADGCIRCQHEAGALCLPRRW